MAAADIPSPPAALTLARGVSRAAPMRTVPVHVPTVADVFVELGAARPPQVDRWPREVAGLLSRRTEDVVGEIP